MRISLGLTRVMVIAMVAPAMATAQGDLFTPMVSVNGAGISKYELDQRVRLLQALNSDGDLPKLAESALIDERIYLQEAKRLEIDINDQLVETGMAEYAARANLTSEQFIEEIGKYGVAEESFREFVAAGLAWRDVVSLLFGSVAAEVDGDEIDERLDLQPRPTLRYALLLEIVIPLNDQNRARALEVAEQIKTTVTSAEQFSATARRLSQTASRENGGDTGWVLLNDIPELLARNIEAAAKDSIVEPTVLNDILYVFFKRDSRRELAAQPSRKDEFAIVEGIVSRAVGNRLIARSSTCNDLNFETRRVEGARYRRQSTAQASAAAGLGNLLSRLDRNEAQLLKDAANPDTMFRIVMLCDRTIDVDDSMREIALQQLRTQKLEDYARTHLADLRARAIIER